MGSLILPSSGWLYLDTQAIIYSVESVSPYDTLLQPVWEAAANGQFLVVSSELSIMEVLIGPFRQGDTLMINTYEQLFQTPEVRSLPISATILREAAQLRATVPKLRTPDAIHAATARLSGVDLFLTNDYGFQQVPGLPLVLLDDVLSA